MTPPSPIDRVFGAIVPRAVGAIDIDEVVGQVDVNELVSDVDVDAIVKRVDIEGLMARVDVDGIVQRVDLDGLMGRVDVDALLQRIDVGALLDRIDLNTLIGRLDMNAVLAQVDINALIGGLDMNAVLAQVDINALMGQMDVDALMDRIDLDAVLAKIDIDALMKRAHIEDIVSNASRGVFARLIDAARRQLVGLDLLLVGATNRVFRRPRESSTVIGGSVTGRVGGGVSRLAAYLIDAGVISVSYGLTVAMVSYMVSMFAGDNVDASGHSILWLSGYGVFGFFYYWVGLAVTGRSIGKGLVGLRVVELSGQPIGPGRAAVRTIVYPFSFILGLGLLPIVVGKQRRALHDFAARDKVLYDWGDRPAEMPAPLSDWVRRQTGGVDDEVAAVIAEPVPVMPSLVAVTDVGPDQSTSAPAAS